MACEVPSKGEAIFHEVTEVFAISIPSPSLPPFLSLPPPFLLSCLLPFSRAVASLSKELICKAAYYESGVRFREKKPDGDREK